MSSLPSVAQVTQRAFDRDERVLDFCDRRERDGGVGSLEVRRPVQKASQHLAHAPRFAACGDDSLPDQRGICRHKRTIRVAPLR